MLKGLGDMGKMMQAAQEMQTKMAEMQESLDQIEVSGESGAGLVRATCSAKGELRQLNIDPSIFNPEEKEVVEDLILAAIKEAQEAAQRRSKEEMERITSELGLPAGLNLPGM